MKNLLKDMMRPLYHYLQNKDKRQYYHLLDRLTDSERFVKKRDVNFLDYTFDLPDAPSFIGQFKEIFLDEIYRFEPINEVPVILDCGSNIGTSLLYFGLNYPNARIVAYEADEVIAKLSIENLKRNGISNVTVINSAVWVNAIGIEFSQEGGDGGSINGAGNRKTVSSIRLKDVLQNEISIDLLKIDIEGAEYEVMMDCSDSLNMVENIFIEYHSWNSSAQKLSEILEVLERNGFRYYIDNVTNRKQPFIDHARDGNMDLQLNIFGYQTRV